jgi:hypothetical protein
MGYKIQMLSFRLDFAASIELSLLCGYTFIFEKIQLRYILQKRTNSCQEEWNKRVI